MSDERYIVIEHIGAPNDGKIDVRTFQDDWLDACKARKECVGVIIDTETMTVYHGDSSEVLRTERDFKWYILDGILEHKILLEEYQMSIIAKNTG